MIEIRTHFEGGIWYAYAQERGENFAVVDACANSEQMAIVRCVAALQEARPGSEYAVVGRES